MSQIRGMWSANVTLTFANYSNKLGHNISPKSRFPKKLEGNEIHRISTAIVKKTVCYPQHKPLCYAKTIVGEPGTFPLGGG